MSRPSVPFELLPYTGGENYIEIPQVNNLRWQILYLNEEEKLEPQTNWFKCKDFFNDVVSAYYGHAFAIYGMNIQSKKMNDNGLWILIKNVIKAWDETFELICNEPLYKELGEQIQVYQPAEANQRVLFIPRECLHNTYRISVITYLIRVSNYSFKYASFEQVITDTAGPAHTKEEIKPNPKLLSWGFSPPEKLKEYWYFAHKDWNSQKQPKGQAGTIHNNGWCNWLSAAQGVV